MKILRYWSEPVQFHPYNKESSSVAHTVQLLINKKIPAVIVEHVGSSSVPNCGGKGIIDLGVFYPDGMLVHTRKSIDALGFQRQATREPFPETRPMRCGAVHYNSIVYRLHVHIIPFGCNEHYNLLIFRNELRRNTVMRKKYEKEKRNIIQSGITDGVDYAKSKGSFIQRFLPLSQ